MSFLLTQGSNSSLQHIALSHPKSVDAKSPSPVDHHHLLILSLDPSFHPVNGTDQHPLSSHW